eukprot:958170-Rhodomonas_salina.3
MLQVRFPDRAWLRLTWFGAGRAFVECDVRYGDSVCAMRCAVLRERMCYRLCYAMCGTEIPCGTAGRGGLRRKHPLHHGR